MLIVKNVTKSYGKKQIVKDFTIDIKDNEIIGLLGPNGAGKTTAFYTISGLTPATSGQIIFRDKDITHMPIYIRSRMGIGYLPQESSIFRNLTVEENIKTALEVKYKQNYSIVNAKAEEILNEFNITHIRNNLGSVLSGGERRRVECARMIAVKPKLVLLDEPFAGVDPIAISGIRDIVFSLRKIGVSVLITDHNVFETLKIVDRAYIMFDGKIICEGSPSEILNNEIVKEVYLGDSFKID